MGIKGLFSCLAVVFILMPAILCGQENPEDPNNSPGTFVLAVPKDAKFAVDTARALEKMPKNRESRQNPVNIIVVFEELEAFLARADMPENWILCFLDAGEAPGEIVICHGGRGYLAPLDLVKPLPSLFRSRQIPWAFKIKYNEIYKLGLAEAPLPVSIAWNDEINSIVLSGRESALTGKTVEPENLAELLADYAYSLNLPLANEDRHYSIFAFRGGPVFFLGERHTAVLLMASLGILFFIFLAFSARYYVIFLFHFRLFFKSIWIIAGLFLLLVLSVKVSFFLCSLPAPVLKALPVSVNADCSVPAFLLAALVFINLARAQDLIRFPGKTRIYGFSAIIAGFLGMVYAAFLDLSYVPFYLWAFFLIFLGASIRSKKVVYLCTAMIPLYALGLFFNIWYSLSPGVAFQFAGSTLNTPGNLGPVLQTALFSLPIYLLAKRGSLLKP